MTELQSLSLCVHVIAAAEVEAAYLLYTRKPGGIMTGHLTTLVCCLCLSHERLRTDLAAALAALAEAEAAAAARKSGEL